MMSQLLSSLKMTRLSLHCNRCLPKRGAPRQLLLLHLMHMYVNWRNSWSIHLRQLAFNLPHVLPQSIVSLPNQPSSSMHTVRGAAAEELNITNALMDMILSLQNQMQEMQRINQALQPTTDDTDKGDELQETQKKRGGDSLFNKHGNSTVSVTRRAVMEGVDQKRTPLPCPVQGCSKLISRVDLHLRWIHHLNNDDSEYIRLAH